MESSAGFDQKGGFLNHKKTIEKFHSLSARVAKATITCRPKLLLLRRRRRRRRLRTREYQKNPELPAMQLQKKKQPLA